MLHGYGFIRQLCAELQDFMRQHDFTSVTDFKGNGVGVQQQDWVTKPLLVVSLPTSSNYSSCAGAALPYFTTHHELVRLQKEAIERKKAARVGLARDDDWSGDGFVAEAESMVANS